MSVLSPARIKLKHKTLLLVAVPLLFQAAYIGVLGILLSGAEREAWKERHSRIVLSECNSLLNNLVTCGVLISTYSFTKEELVKQRFQQLSEQIPQQITLLTDMLKDSPNQKEALDGIQRVGAQTRFLLSHWSGWISGETVSRKVDRQETIDSVTDLFKDVGIFVRQQQEAERIDPQKEVRARQRVFFWLLFGFAFNILLAVFLALMFNKDITRRVTVLVHNTQRLKKGQLLEPPAEGTDEIAHLDGTFHEMADALADAARRKQEIISMVTHDLRTPLTSIKAVFTLLDQGVLGPLSERAAAKVRGAMRSTQRLIGLINDLLDAEKLEAGKLSMEKRPVALSSIFSTSVESVAELARERVIDIDCSDSEQKVLADEGRIVQVLVNLLSNAVKFSPDGTRIQLECSGQEDMVEIRVIDAGRGVPEHLRESIFERFSQVETADGERGKGTGLGLPICKMIVEAHGGRIGCRSDSQGSTFWFTLPCSQ